VKARNMPVTLVFTFLAYTDWSDIWLVLLYVYLSEDYCCFYCIDCCRRWWSELRELAVCTLSGIVYFEKIILPTDPGVAASRFLLLCNSSFAWLKCLKLAGCGDYPSWRPHWCRFGQFLSAVSLGTQMMAMTTLLVACSASRCDRIAIIENTTSNRSCVVACFSLSAGTLGRLPRKHRVTCCYRAFPS
jgi:hypothetical protein